MSETRCKTSRFGQNRPVSRTHNPLVAGSKLGGWGRSPARLSPATLSARRLGVRTGFRTGSTVMDARPLEVRLSTYSAPRGPTPKPAAQRRRRNKPGSFGAAEPVVAGAADEQPPLGFEAHELVADLWSALGRSVVGQFYPAADWQRARWELWYADRVMLEPL
jgi:hypothetical protein